MIPQWIASALLVTPAAGRANAAAIFAQASGNQYDAAPESFSVPICALGGGEITHYACHTRLKDSSLVALPALAALVPGSFWAVTQHDDDSEARAAQRPSVEEALAAYVLQRHADPEDTLDVG
jgi:uncharacterized membrane protein YjjB (DUF3815 family)